MAEERLYLITDGFEDEPEASFHGAPLGVYALVRAPQQVDVDDLRRQWRSLYDWPPRALEKDWPHFSTDTQYNYLLRSVDLMRAAGYSTADLAGPIYRWPRPATMFCAWLVREKGFAYLDVEQINFGEDNRVMTADREGDVRAHREDNVARGWDAMVAIDG